MISDPGFLTLFSSFIGAALFFCAGVFWNERPAPSRQTPAQPKRTNAPELFGVDASALSNSHDDVRPLLGRAAAARKRQAIREPGASRARAVATRKAPGTSSVPGQPSKQPASLEALLGQLQTDLQASSISLLDPQGLLFSEGNDPYGAGARLCTMLSAKDELPQDGDDLDEPKVFVLGRLRLQRLPKTLGPDAWLATVGAKRFAQAQELGSLDRLLAKEL